MFTTGDHSTGRFWSCSFSFLTRPFQRLWLARFPPNFTYNRHFTFLTTTWTRICDSKDGGSILFRNVGTLIHYSSQKHRGWPSTASPVLTVALQQEFRHFLEIWEPLTNLGAREGRWRKFGTEVPLISGLNVQNVVAMVAWRQEFVHPWSRGLTRGRSPITGVYSAFVTLL